MVETRSPESSGNKSFHTRKKKPHRVNSGAESPDHTEKDHETCCSELGTNMVSNPGGSCYSSEPLPL
ncbi:hypothetical protein F2Q69_00009035 [Brassica cretica]|uniref:Uncharacterized protein n=1 Tax=Brassica cretica TaxID=69181 RepID=A0A8S9PAP2_BRACR|nr:hypothetical protein F2Q69_00009035 [Brassica cretica]